MFQSIGFGWAVLAAFLFTNLLWCWDTALTPPPRTMKRKRVLKRTKSNLKKILKHPALPIVQLKHSPAREPVAPQAAQR